jgi:murein DD-endopeptidase MepM/ murein hydrolase activator NlpD
MRVTRLALFLILSIGLAAPAYAADADRIGPEDIEAARDLRARVSIALEATTARYDASMAEEIEIRESLHELAVAVTVREQEVAELREVASEVVLESYMTAGSEGVLLVLDAASFTEIPVRSGYLELTTSHDAHVLAGLEAAQAAHVEQRDLLDQALSRQSELVVEMERLSGEILAQLQEANDEYQAIVSAWEKQEEERKRREAEAEAERLRIEAAEAAAAAVTTTVVDTTTTTTAPPDTTTTTVATTTTSPATTTTSPATTTTVTVETPTTTSTVPSATTTTAPEATTTTTAVPDTTTTTVPSTATTTTVPSTTTTTTTQPPAAPAVATGGKVCPVAGAVAFSNTWGASRSGGRNHKGVDMMAVTGTPLVAIESGGIYLLGRHARGGIQIYLLGASGDMHYYAHLDRYADGLTAGQRVSAGQTIGYVGSTGNATAPHLHLQWRPRGYGDWQNPFPLVNKLCR